MRLRLYQLPVGFIFPIKQSIWVLRRTFEPLMRFIDKNDVAFAPNFFVPRSQLPYGRTTVATVHDLAFKVMPETVSSGTLAALNQNLPGTLEEGLCSDRPQSYTSSCSYSDGSTDWFESGDCSDDNFSNKWGCDMANGSFDCLM